MSYQPNLRLKGLIVSRYNTQSDFAEKVGLNASVVNKVVNNRLRPSQTVKRKFSQLLGVPQQELFPEHE